MAPRLSLPAMTRARLTPSTGLSTTCRRYFSVLPSSCFPSTLPALTSCRTRPDLRLPTMTHSPLGADTKAASVPLTRPKSLARLAAAMRTPSKSSCPHTTLTGFPPFTTAKPPPVGVNETNVSTAPAPTAMHIAKTKSNVFFIIISRFFVKLICRQRYGHYHSHAIA